MRDLAIFNSIVNNIDGLLKKKEFSLKKAPKEEAETCDWK